MARRTGPLACVLAALALACGGARREEPAPRLRPTRGVVLISIDALRADRLGPWGADRPTTPFLDRLARRAVVFENAFCEIPSTLPSHLSMFTGLYPSQHGVRPPSDVLAAAIPTLPELLAAAGVRTFGHSEGGYVQGGYGFARGFEEWTDTPYAADTDVERTLGRGLDSLAKVAAGERFFLFLHTYTVHDPYAPPAAYAARFGAAALPPGAFPATGPDFAAFNRGERTLAPGALAAYGALYDAEVRYLDDVLARFFAGLERLGLAPGTTVILTADHGEELHEHGHFVHTQVYPECLRVPLLVVHPERTTARRVRALAGIVDLAPTILENFGVAAPPALAGRSRLAELGGAGADDGPASGRVFAQDEETDVVTRTVVRAVEGRPMQLIHWHPAGDADGVWMGRTLAFDARGPAVELRAAAFHRPRTVEARVGGAVVARLEIGTEWATQRLALPTGGKQLVTLVADGCERPRDVDGSADERCLAVKLAGASLDRVELYDLAADPHAQRDLSAERPDLVRTLAGELRQYPEQALAEATHQTLSGEQVRQLRALGYL